MADFDIGGILNALTANTNQQVGNLQAAEQQQAYDTTQLQQLLTGNLEAARGMVAQKTDLAMQKATLEARNGQLQERAQAIVGLNPDDLQNDFVKSVARYNAAEDARLQGQAKLTQASSVGILDNPLTWLFNQLELPTLEAKVAGATAERDGAVKDIQARTAMLSQHKNSVIANVADTARQYNIDLAKVSANEAFIKLREEEAKNLSAVSSRKLNEANLRDKVFNVKEDYYNKVLSLDELDQRRKEREVTFAGVVEDRKARLEASNEKAANKAEADAAKEQANLNLQRYAQFTGGPAYTVDMLKMMPKEKAERLWNVATTGSLGANMKEVFLGLESDPTALPTIQANNPLVAQTVTKMGDALSGYITTLSKPGTDGKALTERQAVEKAFTVYEDELTKSMKLPGFSKPLNSPSWDKQYNPYRADHKLMLHIVDEGNAKFLADNLVTKTARSLQATVPSTLEGFTGENETLILKTIAQRVQNRELPAKQAAAQIVQYYNSAVQIGADQTQYGIFKLPLQNRYMVAFPEKDGLDRPVMGDLLNQASVENMLTNLVNAGVIRRLKRPELFNFGSDAIGGASSLLKGPVADALRGYKLEDVPAGSR